LYLFFEPSVLYGSKKSEPKKSVEFNSSEAEFQFGIGGLPQSKLDRYFWRKLPFHFLVPDFRQRKNLAKLPLNLSTKKQHFVASELQIFLPKEL